MRAMAIRTNRRRSPRGRVRAPREPRAAEASYIRDLNTIWDIAATITFAAVQPLLEVWPKADAISGDWIGNGDGGYDVETLAGRARIYKEGRERYIEIAGEVTRLHRRSWISHAERVIRSTVSRAQSGTLPATVEPPPSATKASRAMARMRARATEHEPPRPRVLSSPVINHQLEWAGSRIAETLDRKDLAVVIGDHARRVDRFVANDLSRIIGIDLRSRIPSIQGEIDQWVNTNINLIESGTHAPIDGRRLKSVLGRVESMVHDAHASGLRVEELSGQLQRMGVGKARANLIARDQILKLNGQINRQRQLAAGITQYTWSTSKDERVRDEHADLEGSVHDWNAPPPPGHPGQDYQCRCTAIPIMPGDDEYGKIPTI